MSLEGNYAPVELAPQQSVYPPPAHHRAANQCLDPRGQPITELRGCPQIPDDGIHNAYLAPE